MNIHSEKEKLSPILMGFPPAVTDLEVAPLRATELRLVATVRSFSLLPQMPSLKTLWCFQINHEKLETICQCKNLRSLYIDTLTTTDLSPLRRVKGLRVLSIRSNTKVDKLDSLGELAWLTSLGIENFKNVHSIEPLQKLSRLRGLEIAGGLWSRMKIESLSPLEELRSLQYLNLTNLKVRDESLAPLAKLAHLAELECANFYPMEEFAHLSGQLKQTRCIWFNPYVEMSGAQCKGCGGPLVMLTGKGKPALCQKCDQRRIKKHEEEYRRIAAEASERAT